jgi:16S rRNA (cytosine1402-N4)-methyltransferase
VRIVAIGRDAAAAGEAASLDVEFVAGDFGDLHRLLDGRGVGQIDGVLFDLGVSSRQLDDPDRGFSYRHEGPLDMRMDRRQARTADEVVNGWDAASLADVIRRFGEDPHAARIAAAIVAARPIDSTVRLAEVVASSLPAAVRRRSGGHPARRTFQALRIAVNDELGSVERGLEAAIERLAPGGRCVVISYHSLEDRIVKQRFARGSAGCTCPPSLPVCGCGARPELRPLTRKPLRPVQSEIDANPRARSARLRAALKENAP